MSDQPAQTRSILGDASRYTAATYASQLGSFVTGLVTKGLLGPTNVGLWSLLNISLGYLAGVQLGAGDAVAKEVPYLRAKGDSPTADRLGGAMLAFVLLASTIVGVGVVAIAFWNWARMSSALRVGLLVVGLSFPVWMWVNMQTMVLRAAKRFDVLSRQLLLQLGVTAAIGIPLIWRFSLSGQYAVFLVALAATFLYLRRAVVSDPNTRFRARLDGEALRRLLAIGVPMQLAGLVFTFQSTADSLLAARSLGVTALGYYSLAVTVKGYVYQTPNAFSVVMFPRFQERFGGSQDDPMALRNYVEKPIMAFAFAILPVLIGASWQVVPFLVRHFLPSFVPAIPAIKILLGGTFFASLWHMPGQFLIAINKLWHYVGYAATGAGLVALTVAFALWWRPSIEAVAASTGVAYTVTFLLITGYAVSHFRPIGGVLVFLLEVVAAGVALFALLIIADRLVPAASSLGPDLRNLIARSALLAVAAWPLLWRADRILNLRAYLPWKRSSV